MSNPFKDYELTSKFGMRTHPVYGTKKFHRGVDLVITPANGQIKAFVGGEVLHAKDGAKGSGFGGYGITVAIKDDKGYLHVYAHLSSASVKTGDKVQKGQVIGRQGSTGVSTGPHLHYEIRKKSTPQYGYTATEAGVVEPTKYLQDYYKANKPKEDKTLDKAKVVVNGKAVADGVLIDGTTYVPLRAVGDALGLQVGWDNKSKTATLDTHKI